MQKFQELLTEAAQLKEAQLKNERKNYESLPEYLKSGLNFSRKYQLLRRQDYLIQITVSERLKREGNELFKIEHFPEALAKYEESLGVFRYILAKSYDNMKDEDLVYETYVLPQGQPQYAEEYTAHLVALYLNICSSLTKLNRKEDAIHSADEALKLRETAKGFYKKAQAYLQFINKEAADIKLGFYYLNKSYELSKDPAVVQQMHRIKKEIDEDREKEKKWFKFMFDKNSQSKKEEQPLKLKEPRNAVQEGAKSKSTTAKQEQLKSLEKEKGEELEGEETRLEKTKQKLSRFTDPLQEDWLQLYEGEFIARHGSKIYSIIQLYGYKEYLGEYKALLAQCLEMRKDHSHKRQDMFRKFFQWLRDHPIDKISKYTERYELQTRWIAQQRESQQLDQKGKQKGKEKEKENVRQEIIDEKKEEAVKKEEVAEAKQQQKINKALQRTEIQHGQAEVEIVPEEIKAAVEGFGLDKSSKLSENTEAKEGQQQISGDSSKESKVKLYSFLIALLIILLLKLFF